MKVVLGERLDAVDLEPTTFVLVFYVLPPPG